MYLNSFLSSSDGLKFINAIKRVVNITATENIIIKIN